MCYILSMTSHAWRGHRGGDSYHCTLRWVQQGGHRGDGNPPYSGFWAAPREKKFGPYFSMAGPAHGFVHGFAHGFGA